MPKFNDELDSQVTAADSMATPPGGLPSFDRPLTSSSLPFNSHPLVGASPAGESPSDVNSVIESSVQPSDRFQPNLSPSPSNLPSTEFESIGLDALGGYGVPIP